MEMEAVAELEVEMEQIGPQGYSAYEVYVQNGGTLSETEWLASLKGKDGQNGSDGLNGTKGQDGITPTIGDNGNWYLGDTDTGKPSRGEKGDTGGVSLEEVKEITGKLKDDIDNLNNAIFESLVETDVTGEVKIDTVIDTRTGVEDTRFPNSRCTDFIDISDDAEYYYTGKVFNYIGIAGYDSKGKFVASVLSDITENYTDYKLTIPDGVVKIRASSYSTKNLINPLQIIERKYKGLKDSIADLNYIVKSNSDKISANITTVNHIYVATIGSDETGDGSYNKPFATIYHANESITDASEKNQYIINVADGVYTDLQTRYAGIQSHSNYEGVICKSWVTYEGNIKHPENVVIQWDGKTGYDGDFSYNSHGTHFCPFHITQMNILPSKKYTAIRGFTFDCKNLRYALHIEMSGYGYMTNWEVTDCRFIWHGTPDCVDKTDQTPTIGTGSGFYENGLIARCKIINDSGVTHGFRNHDNDWKYSSSLGDVPKIGANIIIEDCVFGDTVVMFRSIKGDNIVDGFNRFSIINCSGINTLTYALFGGTTKCNWRAEVKASEITSNTFAKESLLQ